MKLEYSPKHFADLIRYLYLLHGVQTPSTLADALDINRATVSRWLGLSSVSPRTAKSFRRISGLEVPAHMINDSDTPNN